MRAGAAAAVPGLLFLPALLLALVACQLTDAGHHGTVLPASVAAAPAAPLPAPQEGVPPPRTVLAWWVGDAAGLASLTRHPDVADIVSPASYRLQAEGAGPLELVPWHPTLRGGTAPLRAAGGQARRVLPLIGCTRSCGRQVSAVLGDAAWRAAHVQALLALARREEAAGLLIDYEELVLEPAHFTDFIRTLAEALHREGRVLAVAVPEPCGRGSACGRRRSPFDFAQLSRAADLLVVMVYDHTLDGSAPVAPEGWMRAGLRATRSAVGPEALDRVVIGLPLYGRAHASLFRGDNSLLWADVGPASVKGQPGVVSEDRFVPEALSRQALLTLPSGRSGPLFYEDHASLAARLRVVEEEGFHAVALWRIGREDPCIWDVLRAWKQRKPAGACPLSLAPPGSGPK